MNTTDLEQRLNIALREHQGYAGILEGDLIVISCQGLNGCVCKQKDGTFYAKAGTEWGSEDKIFIEPTDDVVQRVVDLFVQFWPKRRLGKGKE